jgi:hypothetical protein
MTACTHAAPTHTRQILVPAEAALGVNMSDVVAENMHNANLYEPRVQPKLDNE